MRVLCYAQHLSGVGHFVRMHAIACGLAERHEVHLVEGGLPVPRPNDDPRVGRIALPVIHRRAGALITERGAPAATVAAERTRRLTTAVAEIRPDVVLIDHYPFSKWELEEEILATIAAARDARPGVRVFCSLRDLAPRTRQEDVPDGDFEARVLARLGTWFDGILVHADPAFARLDAHFRAANALPVRVAYTGFVAEPEPAPLPTRETPSPFAVVSCGGGTHSLDFLRAAVMAFTRAHDGGLIAVDRIRVFPGAHPDAADARALRAATADPRVELATFSHDFASQLRSSALSISRAGYNTTVQLLQSRVPCVVVPDPRMSDQGPRARRLMELGLAEVVAGDPLNVAALTAAMTRALARPHATHAFRLDGVAETCAVLAAWPSTTTSVSRGTSR